jgi:hypothetical protein
MERFPLLSLTLRHGAAGSILAALLAAAIVVAAAWPALGPLGIVLGALAGLVIYVLARSYVELVTIVTEMLVPR